MRIRNYLVIAVLMLAAAGLSAFPWQEETPLVVEGVLTGVDIESKTVSLKTANDEDLNLKYTDETKVVEQDERNMQWLKEKVGTKVKISYKLVEEKPQAIRVDVGQPTN